MSVNRKGNGVSGLGLTLRIQGWKNLKGGTQSGTNDYRMSNGETYHKPGSQNIRKGGAGDTRLKRADFPKKSRGDIE